MIFDHIQVLEMLVAAGYESYFVGGCVRDYLLHRKAKDWDITTVATPDEVKIIFPDADFVGAHFGVSLIKTECGSVEVATFRTDGSYGDSRHPDTVTFTKDVKEDLQRRDFTMNALLMDVDGKVIDHVDGIQDLNKKMIRCVGDAEDRFREDALRMLRAIRFSCQLGFQIEESANLAIHSLRQRVQSLSAERIQQELNRILLSGRAATGIRWMDQTGLLMEILPEIYQLKKVPQNPLHHPEGDVFTHTLLLLKQLEKDCSLTLALVALLHDVGKHETLGWKNGQPTFYGHEENGAVIAERILRDLKYPNKVIETVVSHTANHMKFRLVKEMKKAKLLRFVRQPYFEELLQLHAYDAKAGSGNLDHYHFALHVLSTTPPEVLIPERLVTGEDMIAMGFTPGPIFKDILEGVETHQLEGKISTRVEALKFIAEFKGADVKVS